MINISKGSCCVCLGNNTNYIRVGNVEFELCDKCLKELRNKLNEFIKKN